MPHLIVEYTSNLAALDAAALLADANRRLAASGHCSEADIKSRARRLDTFRVGTAETPRAFVHATLSLLPGRPDEVKSLLAGLVLEALQAHAPGSHPQLQLCVAVDELHGASYTKLVLAAT